MPQLSPIRGETERLWQVCAGGCCAHANLAVELHESVSTATVRKLQSENEMLKEALKNAEKENIELQIVNAQGARQGKGEKDESYLRYLQEALERALQDRDILVEKCRDLERMVELTKENSVVTMNLQQLKSPLKEKSNPNRGKDDTLQESVRLSCELSFLEGALIKAKSDVKDHLYTRGIETARLEEQIRGLTSQLNDEKRERRKAENRILSIETEFINESVSDHQSLKEAHSKLLAAHNELIAEKDWLKQEARHLEKVVAELTESLNAERTNRADTDDSLQETNLLIRSLEGRLAAKDAELLEAIKMYEGSSNTVQLRVLKSRVETITDELHVARFTERCYARHKAKEEMRAHLHRFRSNVLIAKNVQRIPKKVHEELVRLRFLRYLLRTQQKKLDTELAFGRWRHQTHLPSKLRMMIDITKSSLRSTQIQSSVHRWYGVLHMQRLWKMRALHAFRLQAVRTKSRRLHDKRIACEYFENYCMLLEQRCYGTASKEDRQEIVVKLEEEMGVRIGPMTYDEVIDKLEYELNVALRERSQAVEAASLTMTLREYEKKLRAVRIEYEKDVDIARRKENNAAVEIMKIRLADAAKHHEADIRRYKDDLERAMNRAHELDARMHRTVRDLKDAKGMKKMSLTGEINETDPESLESEREKVKVLEEANSLTLELEKERTQESQDRFDRLNAENIRKVQEASALRAQLEISESQEQELREKLGDQQAEFGQKLAEQIRLIERKKETEISALKEKLRRMQTEIDSVGASQADYEEALKGAEKKAARAEAKLKNVSKELQELKELSAHVEEDEISSKEKIKSLEGRLASQNLALVESERINLDLREENNGLKRNIAQFRSTAGVHFKDIVEERVQKEHRSRSLSLEPKSLPSHTRPLASTANIDVDMDLEEESATITLLEQRALKAEKEVKALQKELATRNSISGPSNSLPRRSSAADLTTGQHGEKYISNLEKKLAKAEERARKAELRMGKDGPIAPATIHTSSPLNRAASDSLIAREESQIIALEYKLEKSKKRVKDLESRLASASKSSATSPSTSEGQFSTFSEAFRHLDLESELKNVQEQLIQAQAESTQLQATVADQKAANETLKKELERYHLLRKMLEEKRNGVSFKSSSQNERYRSLFTRSDNDDHVSGEEAPASFRNVADAMIEARKANEESLGALLQLFMSLEDAADKPSDAESKILAEVEILRAEFEEKKDEAQQLKGQLANEMAEREEALEKVIGLQKKVKELEETAERALAAEEQAGRVEQEVEQMVHNATMSLKSRIEQLEDTLAKSSQHKAEEFEKYQKQIQLLNGEISSNKHLIQQLQGNRRQLEKDKKELEELLDDAQKKESHMQIAGKVQEQLEGEVQDLTQQLTELQQEAEAQLHKVGEEKAELESQVNRLASAFDRQKALLDTVMTDRDKLKAQIPGSPSSPAANPGSPKNSPGSPRMPPPSDNPRIDELNKQVFSLQAYVRQQNKKLVELRQEIQMKTQEVQHYKGLHDEMKEQSESAEQKRSQRGDEQLKEAQAMLANAADEKAMMQSKISALEAQLNKVREAVSSAFQQHEDMSRKVQTLEVELENKDQRIERLRNENKSLREEQGLDVAETEDIVDSLMAELANAEFEIVLTTNALVRAIAMSRRKFAFMFWRLSVSAPSSVNQKTDSSPPVNRQSRAPSGLTLRVALLRQVAGDGGDLMARRASVASVLSNSGGAANLHPSLKDSWKGVQKQKFRATYLEREFRAAAAEAQLLFDEVRSMNLALGYGDISQPDEEGGKSIFDITDPDGPGFRLSPPPAGLPSHSRTPSAFSLSGVNSP